MMIIAQFQSMRAAANNHAADTDATSGGYRHDEGTALPKTTASTKTEAERALNQVEAFHGSHKCHAHSMQASTWNAKLLLYVLEKLARSMEVC